MIRNVVFALALLGTAAAATATSNPAASPDLAANPAHETVIEKNSPFPVIGPLVVEECAVEDCSDLAS